MIVGTAGHIDHGKTALVRALTGVDGDRLKEEKARGITIDLGFAYLPLADAPPLGFIDVPGHERFVHTMVAGAAGIDIALLVVAADDGVMPQTREHLAILDLLGTRRALIALTKADLATAKRLDEVRQQIRDTTKGTALADAAILAVSSTTGQGIDALRERLVAEARALDERSDAGRFRLAIDRVFTLAGIGVVVTGTVLSGVVRVRDAVRLSPSGLPARVRSLHAQNRPVEIGRAGDRCALNLAGDGVTREAIHRGDMLVDPFLHAPADRIDARLHLLPSEPRAVEPWLAVRLHHGSAEVGARVIPLEGQQLRPGKTADVQLVLDRPVAAAVGDRFVLRDVSARRTMGGGQFIDLRAPERHRRTPAREAERAALRIDDPLRSLAALLDASPSARDLDAFARDRALSSAALDELVGALAPLVFDAGEQRVAISLAEWQRFVAAVLERLGNFHAFYPDVQGMAREKLRKALKPVLPAAAFALALQHADLSGRIVRDGAFVRLAAHTMQMSPGQQSRWTAVAPLLGGEARFRPPRVRDIAGVLSAPEGDIRQLLKLVARMGLVDEVSHDHFFLRATVHEMLQIAADIQSHAEDGWLTAAPFRDRLDCGRKVAILVLEFFDRHGVMLKRGTLRRIQPRYLDLFAPTT
ncbi:MAG TPA: selenocysteine-specific translation elongation factor [Luteibacter sp.]|uniref:selenocysteine-specific translation elongation factor n=1 Tax=Luteibacter sp. TaxID=1886636 RepID=UPI002C2A84E9|nr:selenocysteine-specific translation elongation factor [Luteibacter sp.]HVI55957.1 selenocysteine-specific translation elongation factor [Luteibacter sp.]